MKKLLSLLLLSVVISVVSGCATNGDYETRLPPPDTFNQVFLQYQEAEGEKVMVIAVDMGGQWAFGYDHGRETLKEAAETAAIKCDEARGKHKVFNKAKIFAVNDEVVYYKNQFK